MVLKHLVMSNGTLHIRVNLLKKHYIRQCEMGVKNSITLRLYWSYHCSKNCCVNPENCRCNFGQKILKMGQKAEKKKLELTVCHNLDERGEKNILPS
jgi:hypothetical protein